MSRLLRIAVDHSRCVGNAMCVATAPGVFAHNEERQSVVIDPAAETEERILEAAFNCPTSAIRVEIAEGGERLFPRDAGRASE